MKGIYLVCKARNCGERIKISEKLLKFLVEHAYGGRISELFTIYITPEKALAKPQLIGLLNNYGVNYEITE